MLALPPGDAATLVAGTAEARRARHRSPRPVVDATTPGAWSSACRISPGRHDHHGGRPRQLDRRRFAGGGRGRGRRRGHGALPLRRARRPGERVDGDVVAIFGNVHVAGTVTGSAVAIFGRVELEPGAIVGGDAVAVIGSQRCAGQVTGTEVAVLGSLDLRARRLRGRRRGRGRRRAWSTPTARASPGRASRSPCCRSRSACPALSVVLGMVVPRLARDACSSAGSLGTLFPERLARIAVTSLAAHVPVDRARRCCRSSCGPSVAILLIGDDHRAAHRYPCSSPTPLLVYAGQIARDLRARLQAAAPPPGRGRRAAADHRGLAAHRVLLRALDVILQRRRRGRGGRALLRPRRGCSCCRASRPSAPARSCSRGRLARARRTGPAGPEAAVPGGTPVPEPCRPRPPPLRGAASGRAGRIPPGAAAHLGSKPRSPNRTPRARRNGPSGGRTAPRNGARERMCHGPIRGSAKCPGDPALSWHVRRHGGTA